MISCLHEQAVLRDWLALQEWRVMGGAEPDIPEAVLASLQPMLAASHAGHEELARYQATLSTLFSFYRKSAYVHQELLTSVLIQLGILSMEQFWRTAVALLNMAPDLARHAIPAWVQALHLGADDESRLRTELFHAMR